MAAATHRTRIPTSGRFARKYMIAAATGSKRATINQIPSGPASELSSTQATRAPMVNSKGVGLGKDKVEEGFVICFRTKVLSLLPRFCLFLAGGRKSTASFATEPFPGNHCRGTPLRGSANRSSPAKSGNPVDLVPIPTRYILLCSIQLDNYTIQPPSTLHPCSTH